MIGWIIILLSNVLLLFGQEDMLVLIATSVTWVIGLILSKSAYNNKLGFLDTQPESAVMAIKMLFIVMPIVVAVLDIILMAVYKLDKLYPTIIKDLE